jgi:enterochelin esterase-like enzyme
VNHTNPLHILFAQLFLALFAVGCDKLQPGYYLTPANYPTLPPTLTGTAPPAPPTITPLSTIQGTESSLSAPAASGSDPAPTIESPTLTPSPTFAPCDETEGQIVEESFISQLTGQVFRYRVYLPPCYASTGVRYPYLIMLHGWGAGMDDSQWDRMGLDEAADLGYARGALPPMIIVMPNGNDAQYDWDPGPLPDVILDELMPTIESAYCTWNDSSRRAIGGLSRGGFWAYGIAYTHPEVFDRVGGHSPYFYDGDYPAINPYNLIETADGIERLAMYLDLGVNDSVVDVNLRDFVERLRQRGIEPDYVINPVGAHTEDYWAAHTADYLAFYAAEWPRNVAEYPSCHDPG